MPQTYTVTRVDRTSGRRGRLLAGGLRTPPANIGPRVTPNYEANLGQPAVYGLGNGGKVFAGQRDEYFYIDLGVFDALNLRFDRYHRRRRYDTELQRQHDRARSSDPGSDSLGRSTCRPDGIRCSYRCLGNGQPPLRHASSTPWATATTKVDGSRSRDSAIRWSTKS